MDKNNNIRLFLILIIVSSDYKRLSISGNKSYPLLILGFANRRPSAASNQSQEEHVQRRLSESSRPHDEQRRPSESSRISHEEQRVRRRSEGE